MIPITSQSKFEKVFLDICGPFPRSGGRHRYKYLVIIMDHYTKFVKLYPANRATTNKILGILTDQYFSNVGKPVSIITDHGTQFKGKNGVIPYCLWAVSYTHLDVYKRQRTVNTTTTKKQGCKTHVSEMAFLRGLKRCSNLITHVEALYSTLSLIHI